MGVTGLEPGTSTVSGWRSNQLSYTPVSGTQQASSHRRRSDTSLASRRPVRVSDEPLAVRLDEAGRVRRRRARSTGTPCARPQRQLQPLDAAGLGVEVSPAASVGRPARDERDVALGRANVPPSPAGSVGVGGGTEAAVVALAPVQGVVTALVARDAPSSRPRSSARPAAVSRSSASSYLSAWSSSSG